MKLAILYTPLLLLCGIQSVNAQEIHFTGKTLSNPYLLDGGLKPAVGIHNIQTMRATRSRGLEAPMGTTVCPAKETVLYPAEESKGWTYNHQPMMAYWQGKFWMHFLSDPLGEHIPSSITWLQTSEDGYQWSAPEILFPEYTLPADILDGTRKVYNADGTLHKVSTMEDFPNIFKREGLKAVMHQRVGWYVSSAETGSKLLAIGHYGICLHKKDDPNDGDGIGRVVREIMPDGSMGPVYFFYYNHGWDAKNTNFPYYTKSKDKKFRKAVEEILSSPLYWMQFVEECDRQDSHLPLDKQYKAFNYYTLPDGKTIVSLWKHALTSHSEDGGVTWDTLVHRAPGFVNSNAKIWGQRLSDGMYATVYNPSEFRWPLAISLSADGLDYQTLNLVHGDITEMRYGGNYKSNGPQYVRGILPAFAGHRSADGKHWDSHPLAGNGVPCDSDLWVTYSVNKEDMWVAHIPVPVRTVATSHSKKDEIAKAKTLADLSEWNLYSPVLAPISLKNELSMGKPKAELVLSDADPFDYAKADRLFPSVRHLYANFDITPSQNNNGELQIEFCDAEGNPCSRICWQSDGLVTIKTGARYTTLLKDYNPNVTYHVSADVNLGTRMIEASIKAITDANGKALSLQEQKTFNKRAILYAPISQIERLTFRTGARRTDLTPDTKADRAEYEDLPNCEAMDPKASFALANVTTADRDVQAVIAPHINQDIITGPQVIPALLKWNDYKHYVDYFNTMEDENVAQLIPNSEAADWMEREIPLFECPDKEMEEMYYFRWWTLRKHIIKTDLGFAQTEFLIKRSYSDKYNLIACAVSHHIMESRWLHNSSYAIDEAYNWLRGKDGEPMDKFHKFSDLVPYVLLQDAKVIGTTEWMRDLKNDLTKDMEWWDENHLWCKVAQNAKLGKDEQGITKPFAVGDSLYWQGDVQDGMEESISGGRYSANKRMFHQNRRTTINSYMYGNFTALSKVFPDAAINGNSYANRAAHLKQLVNEKLWDNGLQFFCARDKFDSICQVRELVGYLPWYTEMADDDATKYAPAWLQLTDSEGFLAPFGMTTAERRHPLFRHAWNGRPTCEWDGAIWPFATSQTLTALANVMNDYPKTAALLPDSLFYQHLKLYTESMHRRGRPYVGEYLDEKTGAWLWGDAERSRYYNHSTYNDLIISGLVGLRPSLDNEISINPLIPAGNWSYFCLDGLVYHEHVLTILWDETGLRYGQGRGLTLLVDGKRVANHPTLEKLVWKL
jgi:hypothetical protein